MLSVANGLRCHPFVFDDGAFKSTIGTVEHDLYHLKYLYLTSYTSSTLNTSYRLALPPNLSGVHNVFHVSVIRKYIFDPAHVLDATPLELRKDLSFEEQPVRILARKEWKLRNWDIPYVKVLWSNHEEREAT
uniref:Tf2-1-like SH3-like domain-containing protein n=1 Tax=Ananas comosus var. bracteatus TaxID=296719 RepID=A0A6V7P1R8_ANACO|nr:unnamed protein product [Ananas comosus var. bracteatus]